MWGAARPHAADGAAMQTGSACHAGFIARLSRVMAAEGLGHLDPLQVSEPLWAMVQGYASLLIGKNHKLGSDMESVRMQVDRATRAYFAGLRALEGMGSGG
jgi:hypothetical protein